MRLIRPAMLGIVLFSLFQQPGANSWAAAPQKSTASRSAASQRVSQSDRLLKARTEAAAHVFCYYNNKLSPKKAAEYARYVMEASARYHVDPGLITGLIVKESRANETARSKYASGLMQIYWRVNRKTVQAQFPHIKTEKIMMEPRNNIMVGTWLFSRYMVNCKGNERQALHRYLGTKSDKYVNLVMKYRARFAEQVNSALRTPTKR